MKLAIMQPYFFPYLGYYQLALAADQLLLYDGLDFRQRGWINRNRISIVKQGPAFFTIPIENRKSAQTIRQTKTAESRRWRRKLLRSLEANYRQAPCFEPCYELVRSVISSPTNSLAELAKRSITYVLDALAVDVKLTTDSAPFDALEVSLRAPHPHLEVLFPEIQLTNASRKVIRAIAICRTLGATALVNPIGGRALYSRTEFLANGLDLRFLKSRTPEYMQGSKPFQPNLSIIDTLMCCGFRQTRALLREYDLV